MKPVLRRLHIFILVGLFEHLALVILVLAGEEGQMAFRTLVRVVAFSATLETCNLL